MKENELRELLSKYTIDFLNHFDNFDGTTGKDCYIFIINWIQENTKQAGEVQE